jgi:hypothetical protein
MCRQAQLRRATDAIVLALMVVPALSGCASEFPRDYLVVDATKLRKPVMLSSTRAGRHPRLVQDETIMISDFPADTGANRGTDKLMRQLRKRDRWIQIEHVTFTGHDETSWEYGTPLGTTRGRRSLLITGTAFR